MLEAGVAPKQIKAVVAEAAGLKKGEVFERMERLKAQR